MKFTSSSDVTPEVVAAAQLRMIVDQRLGRTTPEPIVALAAMTLSKRQSLKPLEQASNISEVPDVSAGTPKPSTRGRARFEVYQDAAGKYRYRLKAGNGEIVLVGGGPYETADAARDAIELLNQNFTADHSGQAADVELYQDEGGRYRLRVIASTGEVIAVSESFESMESARRNVARFFPHKFG